METQNFKSVQLSTPETAGIRAFVAAPLAAEFKSALGRLLEELQSISPGKLVRWSSPDQIHLTLNFLGSIPVASIDELAASLRRACDTAPPLELSVEKMGCFPSFKSPRVIWAALTGDLAPLLELQSRVGIELARFSTQEARAFKPHLTLGRVRPASTRSVRELGEKLRKLSIGRIDFRLERLALIRSQLSPTGATYTDLVTIPLVAISK